MIQFYIEKAPMRASCGAFLRLLTSYNNTYSIINGIYISFVVEYYMFIFYVSSYKAIIIAIFSVVVENFKSIAKCKFWRSMCLDDIQFPDNEGIKHIQAGI